MDNIIHWPRVKAIIFIFTILLSILLNPTKPLSNNQNNENLLDFDTRIPSEPDTSIEPLNPSIDQKDSFRSRGTRYLNNIINLDDHAVQLTVFSGNAEDNANNNGNYQNGGSNIATGDIDNDGFEDLVLGSPFANGISETEESAGQVMVIFGRDQTYPGTIFDQAKDNTNQVNLVIHGADGLTWLNQGDLLGGSVACGDIDGDGFDDIVMGAPYADSVNDQRRNAGEVYVIYGDKRSELGTEINLASSLPDIMIFGANSEFLNNPDLTGLSVAVGDVIGDNREDIIIGAPGANPDSRTDAGSVWIISGKSKFNQGSEKDLRSGADLVIKGTISSGLAGFEVEAGDVNGDGRDDILIGAPYAEKNGFRPNAGITYVVYGRQTFASEINLRSGADVVIYGSNSNDYSSWNLAVGNLNGDSYNDIIIGAPFGDGPNNNQDDTGEAYVIYGSAAISSEIDISSNEQDIIIYGENGNDNFGFSVAMGKVDDDNYDDLLISARLGDGQQNGKSNSGETFLIRGNSTANLGNNLDPISDSKSIFYGIDVEDHSGRTVHLADFDSDGYDDIFIAAPKANCDGGRNYAGEYYLVFSQPPPMINRQLELTDGDIDSKTILAKYKPYTFKINATNVLGYKDFKSVTLTIDPLGYNIIYSWQRSNNEFYLINDPLELIQCISTSSDVDHDSYYNYSIEFKLIFNWSFNKTYPIDCKISSIGKRSLIDEDYYPDFFNVNNKLDLKGKLEVTGDIQGKLNEESWIKGGEEITFEGVKVVYSGTKDYYPPTSVYSLGIEDNTNITKIDSANPGEVINTKLNAPNLTVDNNYRFRFLNIPEESDVSSISILLKVDNDPPNPPDFVLCKADSNMELGEADVDDDTEIYLNWDAVTDKDSGTAGYYYSFEDNSGTLNGFWTEDTFAKLTNATEGSNWIYVWVIDEVGNIGFSASSKIFIDLSEVTFENFTPATFDWITEQTVNCTIQVYDRGGFGIDINNIWYWNIQSNKWVKVVMLDYIDLSNVNLTVQAKLNEGTSSFISFRAFDLAGNGPTESPVFNFRIDTKPVTYVNEKPGPFKKLSQTNVKCVITVQDLDGSGVNLSTIQYSYSTSGLGNFTDWSDSGLAMQIDTNGDNQAATWFVNLRFKRGAENYIRWRAMDIAGNGWTISDNYPIFVNALPTIVVDEVEPSKKFYSDKKIEISAKKTFDIDNHNNDLKFSWRSNITGEIGKVNTLNTKLPAGDHGITLTVFDGLNNASYQINLSVKDPKQKDELGGLFGFGVSFDYLILIIILIIIILSFLVIYNREKKRRKLLEEERLRLAMGSEISYIPPRRQPMFPGGYGGAAPTPLASAPGAQPVPSIPVSPYGTTGPVQQLPGVGGIRATPSMGVAQPTAQQPSVGVTPTVAGPGSGTVGRQVPQLPPAQAITSKSPIMPDIEHLDPKRKLELLEKKMLMGEIPLELYTKLSAKYELELKSRGGPAIPPKPQAQKPQPTQATPQIHLPSTQFQQPTQPQPQPQPRPQPQPQPAQPVQAQPVRKITDEEEQN